MKYLISIILSALCVTNVSADKMDFSYSPRVEVAFEKFIGQSISKTEAYISGVEIIGEKISERPKSGMPITLKFDVEKVLLLNAGGNNYSYDGLYFKKCANEPVTVFKYTEVTKIYPKKLKINMRTECIRHQIVLLLWVKTTNGDFYRASFPFNTTSNHY